VVDAAAASLHGAAGGLLQELYRGEDREMERETDGQSDGQSNGLNDGQTDGAGDGLRNGAPDDPSPTAGAGPLWAAPDQ
jgi:hypothetical protein